MWWGLGRTGFGGCKSSGMTWGSRELVCAVISIIGRLVIRVQYEWRREESTIGLDGDPPRRR
jgi:hypothetical protein